MTKLFVAINHLNGCVGRLVHKPQGVEVRYCFIDETKAKTFARSVKGRVIALTSEIDYALEEHHVYIADRVEESLAGKGKGKK